jgi:hypothetical protein
MLAPAFRAVAASVFRAVAADTASAPAYGRRAQPGSHASDACTCLSRRCSVWLSRRCSRHSVCSGLRSPGTARLPRKRCLHLPFAPSQPTQRLLRLTVAGHSPAPTQAMLAPAFAPSQPVDRRKLEEREAIVPQRRDFCRPPAGWAGCLSRRRSRHSVCSGLRSPGTARLPRKRCLHLPSRRRSVCLSRRRSRHSVCSGLRSPGTARLPRKRCLHLPSRRRSRWIGGSSRSVRRLCLSDETSAVHRRVGRAVFRAVAADIASAPAYGRRAEPGSTQAMLAPAFRAVAADMASAPACWYSEPVDRRKLEKREAILPQRRDFCRPPADWA